MLEKKISIYRFQNAFLKIAHVTVKELGMSQEGQIEIRNPIVPIDLQMGE